MRNHCTPTRVTKIWNTDDTKHGQGCRATETITAGENAKRVQPLWKTACQFLSFFLFIFYLFI